MIDQPLRSAKLLAVKMHLNHGWPRINTDGTAKADGFYAFARVHQPVSGSSSRFERFRPLESVSIRVHPWFELN